MSRQAADSLWLRLVPGPLRSHLAGRRLLQTLLENTGWLVADKVVRLGVGLFVSVWVARYLGPERFGALNYVQAVVWLISALATMGLPDIVVRDFVREPKRSAEIASTALALRLLGAAVSIAIATITIIVARPDSSELVLMSIVLGASFLPQALDVVDQLCQARNQVRPVVIMRNVAFLTAAAAKIAAILLGAPLMVFAGLITFEFALVGIALYVYSRRLELGLTLANASLPEARRLLGESWPLIVRLLAIGIYMRIDQVIIGQLLNDRAVGIYAAAMRISEIWYFIPVAMMTAFVPRLAAEHAKSTQSYEALLLKVMRVIVVISAVAALSLSIGATFVVGVLYGAEYAGAAQVLAVHAWSGLFVGLGVASSSWFVNNGLLRFALYQALAGAAVSAALNFALIPYFGVIGAAWASITSYAVSAVLLNLFFAPTRPIFRLQMRAIGLP